MSLVNLNDIMKDLYPGTGTRLKQWVVDTRREAAWERETCPTVSVGPHEDNTGIECRNAISWTPWAYLNHDCCYICNVLQDETRVRADIQAWLVEKGRRPPVERDRTKLSDEVQADVSLGDHPLLKMVQR